MHTKDKELNIILPHVAIVRDNRDDYNFYNIHELDELHLKEDDYHKCRYIDVGGKINFQDKQFEITKITFRLNPVGDTLRDDFEINTTEPSHSNSALYIFVKEI